MPKFEYKVVLAPTKGKKGKGVWGAEAKFANAVEILMNELGAQGWEYQRSDMLPLEERAGLTKTTTSYKNLLVFRRQSGAVAADFNPRLLASPLIEDPVPTEEADPLVDALHENGVEDVAQTPEAAEVDDPFELAEELAPDLAAAEEGAEPRPDATEARNATDSAEDLPETAEGHEDQSEAEENSEADEKDEEDAEEKTEA